MKYFDIDYIDDLDEQQVRYLLKSELERNKLLIRQNKFALFRYEVQEDTMILLYEDETGQVKHLSFDNYSSVCPGRLFDRKEHQRLVTYLHRVVTDTDFPKTGAEDFFYKDGIGVRIEYSCLFDEVGNVLSVVGQHVDVYQTHDRMIKTIQSLNEQVAMTDAIRQTYETMLTFSLEDYQYLLIQGTPEVRAASMKVKSVIELAELFCKHYVDPMYHDTFRQFVNEGTITDRLEGSRYVAVEYMTKNIGWCRARIMPADIDSNGHVTKAIFTTESAVDHQDELTVLRVAATTDGLTGLLNRTTGEKEIINALEKKSGGVFALFDCDSFKNINDKLGHPTGDQVLIEVSKSLKDVFSKEIVLRLGGDEFVVFITTDELLDLAEKEGVDALLSPLHDRLQQVRIRQMNGLKPSLSCGAVLVRAGSDSSLSQIYELADKLLYSAKVTHNGSMKSEYIN